MESKIKEKSYGYLIIESNWDRIKVGDIITDNSTTEQDNTWNIFDEGNEYYFRGLRLFEVPDNLNERNNLLNLIKNAMRNIVFQQELNQQINPVEIEEEDDYNAK